MATVSQQRGKWKCQVRLHGYPHHSRTFPDLEAAETWGREVEYAMRSGTFDDKQMRPPPELVRDMLQRYIEEVSPRKTRNGQADAPRVRRLQATLGAYSVHTLQSSRIARYKEDRLAAGAAAQTVLHDLVILHHAYTTAVDEWGLRLNHAIPRTKKPTLPRGRNFRVQVAEMAQLQRTCRPGPMSIIIELAIETCMRRSELVLLLRENVSLEAGTAFLPCTKNGESRTVPLTPRAIELLRPLIEGKPSGRVFRISPDAVTLAFVRAARNADLSHLHFHDLRHEGISRLFEKGLNLIEVARISGHKTLSQLNRYTHLDVGGLVEKLAKMGVSSNPE